jgi:hypothetical protein
MAQAIRQIGLKLTVALLRLFVRDKPAGWQRSTRPLTLRGR